MICQDGEFIIPMSGTVGAANRIPTDPDRLADAYVRSREQYSSGDFLKEIEGLYSAVIWDKKKQVHLISDWYCTMLLYWTKVDGVFIWGTKLTVFPAHPKFSAVIDTLAIEEFISLGIIITDRTYFERFISPVVINIL
jgi:asparagine synthase (glutamine-hydrolysing)